MPVKKKKSKSDSKHSLSGFLPGILTGIVLTVTFNYVFTSNPEVGKEKIEEMVYSEENIKKAEHAKKLRQNHVDISVEIHTQMYSMLTLFAMLHLHIAYFSSSRQLRVI